MLFVLLFFKLGEARVFCEDSNAMARTSSGYTCPVICASVENAVHRLIMLDYKKTVQEELGKTNVDAQLLNEINFDDRILREKHTKLTDKKESIEEFKRITNLQNAGDVLRRDENDNNKANGTRYKSELKCWYLEKFKPSLLVGKIVRRKCTRKSNFDSKFLSIMTNILNKYVGSDFKFTEEMTEILLENIFGQNTDLRNNIFDINKLLKYLRKSVDLHKSHSQVVTLKSRKCLTMSMPGCYCKPGYVESSGQCVKPSDCITDKNYYKYLKRIIVV